MSITLTHSDLQTFPKGQVHVRCWEVGASPGHVNVLLTRLDCRNGGVKAVNAQNIKPPAAFLFVQKKLNNHHVLIPEFHILIVGLQLFV